MTFLEFVCHQLIGPPVSGSCWPCPFCDSGDGSLSVRPPKGNLPIKYKCFRCGEWGDEMDLLKLFYPGKDFRQRQVRRDALQESFDSQPAEPIHHRGTGSTRPMSEQLPTQYRDDPQDVALVWANLQSVIGSCRTEIVDNLHSYSGGLQLLIHIVEECEANSVSIFALRSYWRHFEDWIVETDQQHLAECNDPDCDAIVCRGARGLPPLTQAKIEAGRREAEESRRTRQRQRAN